MRFRIWKNSRWRGEWKKPQTVKRRYDALRRAWQEGGPLGYWQEQWNQVDPDEYYWKGTVQLHLGNTNVAFFWLNKSFETREQHGSFDGPLNYLIFDRVWDGVRDDQRFQELLHKVGFTKVNPRLKKVTTWRWAETEERRSPSQALS